MTNVLFICTDAMLAGSSASLINLISSTRTEIYPIVLLPERGSVLAELEKMGVQTIIHPFYCFGGPRKKLKTALHHPNRTQLYHYLLDNQRCASFVKDALRAVHIDIVHSNTTLTTVGVNISKALKTKHVWHVREHLPSLLTDIYGGVCRLKNNISSADATIFISNELEQKWDITCKHPLVIMDAVRSENDLCYCKEKQKYFLFCSATIYSFKGPEIAIRAFADSGTKTLGYRLRMVGECEQEQKNILVGLAKSLNCADAIEWVGYTDIVRPHFERATAFLMCSEFEGLGRVTAEAMFYGCPVIARATGGTMDLVKNGETGWLFSTVEECAQLINKVCSEDQTEIISKAQDFAVHNMSEEVYGPQVLEVYKTILEK